MLFPKALLMGRILTVEASGYSKCFA